MATSSAPFNRKRSNAKQSNAAIPIATPCAEPGEAAPGRSFARAFNAVFNAPARWTLIVTLLALASAAGIGCVLRVWFPQCVVVVQPIEVSPELAKQLALSSKMASDVLIDSLNQHSEAAAQFRGADYYNYGATGAQTLALKKTIRVPVQSSNDIEVNGISIGTIMKFFSLVRNKQWLISGDILTAGDQTVMRLRLNGEGVARYWEIPKSAGMDGVSLIRTATEKMLADQNPEMLGRSFLQQGQYHRAIDVFRTWTLNEPRNWRPSYYLSLAYDYNNQPREASSLARWSAEIAGEETRLSALEANKPASSTTGTPEELAAVTQAVSLMNQLPAADPKSADEASERLKVLQQAEELLNRLAEDHPSNLNYSIQLARILDREAGLEVDSLARLTQAWKDESRALELIDKAIAQAPDNGGLYEQRSVLLQQKAKIGGKQGLPDPLIQAMKAEETDGFRSALVLNPRNPSPLWGAVYGLIDRHEDTDALEIAQTILLLEPKSAPAQAAYTLALINAGKKDEAKQHLPVLLDTADQSELQTLSHSFEKSGDSESWGKIGEACKRRFAGSTASCELKSGSAS